MIGHRATEHVNFSELEIGLCWGTIHQASLVEAIDAAARHGFSTLQIPPIIYFDYIDSGGTPQALRRRLADAGTSIRLVDAITAGLPGMPTDSVQFKGRQFPRDDATRCLEVAEDLEAPLVNVSHYLGQPVRLDRMAEAMSKVCRQAARSETTIVLEFVPDSGIRNIAEAQAIAEACGEPNCRVHLDTWHLARSGGTVADLKALPLGAIGAFQLSDRIEPSPGSTYVPMTGRLLPGEGELPLRAIVREAISRNPGLTLEIEVFSEELSNLSLDAAADRAAQAVRTWRNNMVLEQ